MRWDEIHRKQILYSVGVVICFASIFGFIIFLNAYNNAPADYLPSPSPANLSDILMKKADGSPAPQIQGVATQADPLGPNKPLVSPSVAPSIAPSPSIQASQSPSSLPSVAPSIAASSNPTSTPTPVPQSPGNLKGEAKCEGSNLHVDLNWDSVGGANSYKVYKNGSVISTGSSSTSYSDTSVVTNTNYLYFIRAVNSAGESGDSNSVSVSPPSCP